jgi:predicted DNA-binding protein
MPTNEKRLRQSISLPPDVARRVRSLAKAGRKSTTRVLVDLVEAGLEAREAAKKHFLTLADRLARTRDKDEQERLKEELARLTFGA